MEETKVVHKKKKLTPKMRFQEFSGEWEKKKLGDVSFFLDGRRKPIKSEDRSKMKGEYPYYGASGIIDYVNEYIFDEEIILLGEDGENIVSRNLPLAFRVSGKCWINNHAHVIKNNEGTNIDFLTILLERTNYLIYNTGTAQPKLNQEVCRGIPLNFPSLPEQQKIASFLSAVDEKIQLLNRKKQLLEQYKKGVMQQLFSGKLRFKDENGKIYPKWEEKKLGDVLVIGSGKDYKHLGNGDIPVFGTGGLMTTVDDFLYDGETVCIGRKGTIDKPMFYNGKIWTVDTLFYTHKFKNVTPKFIFVLFQQVNWKLYNEASGVPSLSKATIEKLKFSFPCLEEQKKIADFLSAIDVKIENLNNQITQTQNFKKGLLQQMFV